MPSSLHLEHQSKVGIANTASNSNQPTDLPTTKAGFVQTAC
jgi:hypothetical protein